MSRIPLLLLLLCSLGFSPLKALEPWYEAPDTLAGSTQVAADSTKTDSLPPAPARSLLPANISWMERGLWGEHSLLRSVGIASPLTPEVRKGELSLRRTMLTIHQLGGFVTLGLMGTTVYFGQQVLNGRYDLLPTHKAFVAATIASYTLTAMMAVFSPPPFIRRDEVSTTTIHKALAWIHFAGMVVTPILGRLIAGSSDYYRQARFHQVSAYITTAALAASMIVITF